MPEQLATCPVTSPHMTAPTRSSNKILFFDAPSYKTNVPVRDRNKYPGGVLHLQRGDTSQPLLHYWLGDLANVEQSAAFFLPLGYEKYSFTPYTSKDEWNASYPSDMICGDFPAPIIPPPPPGPPPPPPTPYATPRQPPVTRQLPVPPSLPPQPNPPQPAPGDP